MHGVQEDSARTLFRSLPRFRELGDELQVWPAHGAGSTCGKALGAVPTTTVGYERRYNASLAAAAGGEAAFVDAILSGQPEPQMYFARMKRDNRDGVPLLGALPDPQQLTTAEFSARVQDGRTLVVDTRLDRSAVMATHVPGFLYAPINNSFNTVVGSLVMDEATPLLLIVEPEQLEAAVRDLVRIGYDNIVGFITADILAKYFEQGGASSSIPECTFADLEQARHDEHVAVLDVRFSSEFDAAHVPGAYNASYTRLPAYLETRVPSDRTLYVHCASGARSAAASSFLKREGFDVRYVNGAFAEYAREHETASREAAAPALG
jgi:hydroxyacylglutathione hydrolase